MVKVGRRFAWVALAPVLAITHPTPFSEASVLGRCLDRVPSIIGTPGDDRLRGTPQRDVISALDGNDRVVGLGGNDMICAGPGDDVVLGGAGHDLIAVDTGADVAEGGEGNDLIAEFFEDSFFLVDVQVRDLSEDRLAGGPGIDLLWPEGGNDTLLGGPDLDHVFHVSSFSPVYIDLNLGFALSTQGGFDSLGGIEAASGSIYSDVIIGDDGPNLLWGVFSSDHIMGGEGGDYLFAAIDGDMLDGGSGEARDTVVMSLAEPSEIDLSAGTTRSREHPEHAPDSLVSIENAVGQWEADDVIIGNDEKNVLWGLGGDDRIDGAGGDDVLYGDGIYTTVWGSWDFGAKGKDHLDGGAGGDLLVGGPLKDRCVHGERTRSCEDGDGKSRESRASIPNRTWWIDELPRALRYPLIFSGA